MGLSWHTPTPSASCGVILGCDEAQEWMLPWWWERYSEHNNLPVTFIDFGLSDAAKAFCEQKGKRLDLFLPEAFNEDKEQVPSSLKEQWANAFAWEDDPFWWNKRKKCHQKPFAFLMTPYKHTLWIDVDCEVITDLSPLFTKISTKDAIYIAARTDEAQKFHEEKGITLPGEIGYNSGVVGFHLGSSQVLTWAEKTIREHPFFISDEDLLARIAFVEKWDIETLEPYYNWLPHFRGFHPAAKINHWVGNAGKFFLSLRMQKIL